jgi:acetyl esterase/lipase
MGLNRREVLGLTAALIASESSAQTLLAPPPPPKQLPKAWAAAQTITLWPGKAPGADNFKAQTVPSDWSPGFIRNTSQPQLHVFRPAKPTGRALLVCPGGAYQFVSVVNEGVDLAARMNALGLTVFVLTYRLPGEGWHNRANVPLQDAQRAMRVIRSRATQFGVNPDTVSVLGFSAGGHLAATLTLQHDERVYDRVDRVDDLSPRPFAAALVYPVLTMLKPWTHEMSRNLLLGATPSDAEVRHRSAEFQVTGSTPPLFIVHAMDDEDVPVENSLRLLTALREARRPVEAHLLQEGGHAFGIGHPGTPSAHWIESFDHWSNRLTV